MTSKFALIGTAAIVLALSFNLVPSAFAQAAIAAHPEADALASRRVHRTNPAVPFEAFGALAGAIASIAAAEHQRESYGPYYSPYSAPYASSRYPTEGSGTRQAPALVTREAAGRM
jgi:hypothetical protein